jgi:hypothetical protein
MIILPLSIEFVFDPHDPQLLLVTCWCSFYYFIYITLNPALSCEMCTKPLSFLLYHKTTKIVITIPGKIIPDLTSFIVLSGSNSNL